MNCPFAATLKSERAAPLCNLRTLKTGSSATILGRIMGFPWSTRLKSPKLPPQQPWAGGMSSAFLSGNDL
jgi:hypothetical protein